MIPLTITIYILCSDFLVIFKDHAMIYDWLVTMI